MGMRVGQVAGFTIEKSVMHQTRRVGHAAQGGQSGHGRHQPAPAAGLTEQHRFGQKHFLGHKTVEQRHAGHGGRRGHGQGGGPGHQAPQAAELAHVTRAGFVVHDAGGHEQRRFERRVVEDVKNGRHRRQRRAQTHQKGDQTQVADGGVGQQALEVVLENGHERGKRQRDQASTCHQCGEQFTAANHRRQARQQKDTGLDHGGRVQVSRHRRGGRHGLR